MQPSIINHSKNGRLSLAALSVAPFSVASLGRLLFVSALVLLLSGCLDKISLSLSPDPDDPTTSVSADSKKPRTSVRPNSEKPATSVRPQEALIGEWETVFGPGSVAPGTTYKITFTSAKMTDYVYDENGNFVGSEICSYTATKDFVSHFDCNRGTPPKKRPYSVKGDTLTYGLLTFTRVKVSPNSEKPATSVRLQEALFGEWETVFGPGSVAPGVTYKITFTAKKMTDYVYDENGNFVGSEICSYTATKNFVSHFDCNRGTPPKKRPYSVKGDTLTYGLLTFTRVK